MTILRILALMFAGIAAAACTNQADEKVVNTTQADEEIVKQIEDRLRKIENIDARISAESNEYRLIEIELRELQSFFEEVEAQRNKDFVEIRNEIQGARDRLPGDQISRQGLQDRVRDLSAENARLKAELGELKTATKD